MANNHHKTVLWWLLPPANKIKQFLVVISPVVKKNCFDGYNLGG